MIQIACSFALVLAYWISASSAREPAFQFSRRLTTPAASQAELLAVALDAAIFAATETDLADIRLLDGQGGAVPYLLRQAQTTRVGTVRNTWPAERPAARPLPDGGLEILIELKPDDPIPNGLSLITRRQDFEQRVRVFSSPHGDRWDPAGEETVIFDYSRFMDVRQDNVRCQETANRHFRIVIDDVTAEQESELLALTRRLHGAEEMEREEQVTIERRPFRIERVDFWREVERERSTGSKKTEYRIERFRVEQDQANQQTLILIDSGREPLTSLVLQTPAKNFSRRATVEALAKRGVEELWTKIGGRTLSRVDFKGLQQEELAVEFPESRRDAYRLIIDNRDSPPLQVTGIKASGNVYELLFLAAPDTTYQLLYGSADADPPHYDTAAIRQVLSKGFRPAQAELGTPSSAADRTATFQWSDLLNDRRLLFGVIALLVAVLAAGLYQAVQRFDNLPRE